MTHHTRNLGIVLTMTLALALAGCGNPQSSESSDNAANITFRTDPVGVQVWIDGTNAGTTPVVIAVDAGQHEIELKRDGFASVKDALTVEAGKDLTVKSGLTLAGSDEESRFKTLLAAIGIERHENLEGKTHRGAMKNGVMLYWPQHKVRRAGMSTWRIEFGIDYDDDATLEFRKGKKVLHRVPLIATSQVVEGALPPAVMEELKRGTSITWGAYFEDRKKKNVTAKFKVDSGKSLQKKLDKIKRRSVYRRAGPLERELIKIELKRNYRFYTEALTDAMSVMNTWDETQLADKVIVDSLQRLKLKDSMLYVEIMQRVGGRGPNGRAGGGQAGLGKVTRPLAQSLVAPKVRAPKTDSGTQAGPKAGLGVTPTTGDQKRDPGPIEAPGAATGDAGDQAREHAALEQRETLRVLEEKVEDLEKESSATEQDEARAGGIKDAFKDASEAADKDAQAVTDAEAQLEAVGPGGSASEKADAQSALDAAKAAQAQSEEKLRGAQEAMDGLDQERPSEHQSSAEAKEQIERLKNQIEQLKKAGVPGSGELPGTGTPGTGTPGTGTPGTGTPGTGEPRSGDSPSAFDDPLDPQSPQNQPKTGRKALEQDYDNAKRNAVEAATRAEVAARILSEAEAALKAADDAVGNDLTEAKGGQKALDDAELRLQQAHEDGSRAVMENERAKGDARRTQDELAAAKEALDKHDADPENSLPNK